MEWDAASVVKARDDAKLSPYRAGRLAAYLNEDVMYAICSALADTSKSDAEASYWLSFPTELSTEIGRSLEQPLTELELRLSRMKHKPNAQEKAKLIAELVSDVLAESWTPQPSVLKIERRKA